MSLLAIACMRHHLPPVGSLTELLEWARRPLGKWPLALPLDEVGAHDVLLEGPDGAIPTRFCQEVACQTADVETHLREQGTMFEVFERCRTSVFGQESYVAFRTLLTQHIVLTDDELRLKSEIPQLEMLQAIIEAAYPPAARAYMFDGAYHTCHECGSLVLRAQGSTHVFCDNDGCVGKVGATIGRSIPRHKMVRYLRRDLRIFIASPGKVELALAAKLQTLGLVVEMWPGLDKYDLGVTFPPTHGQHDAAEVWAIDVKDWSRPARLAQDAQPIPPEPPWDRAFFVFPEERRQYHHGDYCHEFEQHCARRLQQGKLPLLTDQVRACFVNDVLDEAKRHSKARTRSLTKTPRVSS